MVIVHSKSIPKKFRRQFLFIITIVILSVVLVFSIWIYREKRLSPEVVVLTATKAVEELPSLDQPIIFGPAGVAIYHNHLYVADKKNNRILILDTTFSFARHIGKKGRGPAELEGPTTVRVRNEKLYVGETGNQRIQIMDLQGNYISSFAVRQSPVLNFAVSSDGFIFLHEPQSEHLVSVFDESGTTRESFGELFPFDDSRMRRVKNSCLVELDDDDNVYVALYERAIVRKYDKTRQVLWENDLSSHRAVRNRLEEIKARMAKDERLKYGLTSVVVDVKYLDENLFLLGTLSSTDARIFVLNCWAGELKAEINIDRKNRYIFHFAVATEDRVFFTDRLTHSIVLAERTASGNER
jgi:DNA-binding beta-propeller fold protein YncE